MKNAVIEDEVGLTREETKEIFGEDDLRSILEEQYVIGKKSTNQISSWFRDEHDLKISYNVIYLFLKEFSLPIRNQSESDSLAVRNLDYDEEILKNNPVSLEALDGLLISDGYISSNRQDKYHRVSLSSVQKEFVDYSRGFFLPFKPSEILINENNSTGRNRGYEKTSYTFNTSHHPDLTKQRIRWYKNKVKRIPKDIKITPLMLKLWYYGDGSIVTKRGKSNTCVVRLSTDGFLNEDIDFLVEQLEEQVGIYSKNSDKRIRIFAKSIRTFFNFIGRESDISCYSYKFDVDEWRFLTPLKEAATILDISYNRLVHLVGLECIDFERSPGGKKVGFTDSQLDKLRALHQNGLLTADPRKNSASITKNSFNQIPQELKSIVASIRSNGFPYVQLTDAQKMIVFNRLNNVPCLSFRGSDIDASYRDNDLPINYHPHLFHVKCGNALSPFESFSDDLSLSKVIEGRRLKKSALSNDNLRYDVCRCKKTKRTSVFPVRVAKTLYTEYGKNNMRVFDPCSGYSSRLLGFYACARGGEYVGTDPCVDTYNGLLKTIEEVGPMSNNHTAKVFNEPAESMMKNLESDSFDMVFTSPPYFDLEKYSNEKTQSYVAYSKYEDWLENFLFEIIRESHRIMKNDGYFLLNVANCGSKDIIAHTDLFVKKMFRVENVLRMNSPSMFSSGITEPIFVLRKD
jgi:16S rRNA G966 N2-methylase RsmD